MTQIHHAIIPVAGWGTRRLPITKTVEKCMLPIGDRPLVDYVVQDCIAAGITDIYFVVSENSQQIRDYYSRNDALEAYLRANGKEAMLPLVQPPQDVTFHFVTQPTDGKYGTTIPVALAAAELPADEPAVVLMGDDFIYNEDGSSEVARLVGAMGDGSAMLGVTVSSEDVSRYGVIETDANNNFVQIVEKPSVEAAPSNLINVSKYALTAEALRHVVAHAETEQPGEYYITDAINSYVEAGGSLAVVPARGAYLDGGSVAGWVHANNVVVGASS